MDDQGLEQGPFATAEIRSWLQTGDLQGSRLIKPVARSRRISRESSHEGTVSFRKLEQFPQFRIRTQQSKTGTQHQQQEEGGLTGLLATVKQEVLDAEPFEPPPRRISSSQLEVALLDVKREVLDHHLPRAMATTAVEAALSGVKQELLETW